MVLGVPILEYFRVCEQSTVKVSESYVRFKIPPTKRWFEKALRRMAKLKMIELLPLKVYSTTLKTLGCEKSEQSLMLHLISLSSIAHSLSLSSEHRPDMTEILLKRTQNGKSS